jgi:hypothetical protein
MTLAARERLSKFALAATFLCSLLLLVSAHAAAAHKPAISVQNTSSTN